MMCYRDMTFCSASDCENIHCQRNWRLLDKTDYKKWSEGFEDGEGPIAMADYRPQCPHFTPYRLEAREAEHAEELLSNAQTPTE